MCGVIWQHVVQRLHEQKTDPFTDKDLSVKSPKAASVGERDQSHLNWKLNFQKYYVTK